MSAPMEHRPLAAGDLDALHSLFVDERNNPFLDYEPMDLGAFRAVFDDLLRAGDTTVVVDGDRVVGTYRVHVQAHRCAHVATLGAFALHADFRGRGVGGAILDAIVARLRARGVRRVELLAEADNAHALRFYEKHGFVREGVLRGAFRRARDASDVDEIAMARFL